MTIKIYVPLLKLSLSDQICNANECLGNRYHESVFSNITIYLKIDDIFCIINLILKARRNYEIPDDNARE